VEITDVTVAIRFDSSNHGQLLQHLIAEGGVVRLMYRVKGRAPEVKVMNPRGGIASTETNARGSIRPRRLGEDSYYCNAAPRYTVFIKKNGFVSERGRARAAASCSLGRVLNALMWQAKHLQSGATRDRAWDLRCFLSVASDSLHNRQVADASSSRMPATESLT